MTKILEEKKQLNKEGDNFVWSNVFKSEMNQEDFNRNYVNLSRNIFRLKFMIKQLDINKAITTLKNEHAHRIEVSREALKNFEKYMQQELKAIKQNKDKQKKDIQYLIANKDSLLETAIEKKTSQLQAQIDSYQRQLNQHEEDINYYKGHMTKELIDTIEQQTEDMINGKEETTK